MKKISIQLRNMKMGDSRVFLYDVLNESVDNKVWDGIWGVRPSGFINVRQQIGDTLQDETT